MSGHEFTLVDLFWYVVSIDLSSWRGIFIFATVYWLCSKRKS